MANAAVGISFGSESCVVAVTNTSGNPQVYANADGDRITPTYVAFIDGEVVHGAAGRTAFVRQPVQSVPFLLPLLSPEVVANNSLQPKCELEVVVDPTTGEERVVFPTVDSDGVLPSALPRASKEDMTTPHYASELLTSFLSDVKAKTIDGPCSGRPISCLCVSIPRYLEQNLVRTAVESAGLAKEVRVIYDDVASAVAHQIGNTGNGMGATMSGERQDIAVVDWGANVLAASILRLEGGVYRLLGHSHKFNAGGAHLDKHLAKACCDTFYRKTKINAAENGRSMRKLLLILEGVRKTLTMSTMAPIDVEAFCEGMDFKDSLSRVKLDMAIRESGLLDKLNGVLKSLLESVDPVEGANVSSVILSGGLCRTQFIQQSVKLAVQNTLPGGATAQIIDAIPTDEVAALGACTEAFLSSASNAALTKVTAEVPISQKYRPVVASSKDVDSVDVESLEVGVALYIGSTPLSKVSLVPADKVSSSSPVGSPTSAAFHKDFTTMATERGAYQVPTDQLYILAARGAPTPVSSPLVEASEGASILPVAIIASNGGASFVIPLFKKPHKLAGTHFKVLASSEKNGSVMAITVLEQDNEGTIKVAQRAEW
eukprot:GILI01006757.1.p1 GENE.GILI01006757.1~~GILI01006757.1.p1  ORF type:complete len:601 (+),score=137.19 GILI01006757.1:43-1845(+)